MSRSFIPFVVLMLIAGVLSLVLAHQSEPASTPLPDLSIPYVYYYSDVDDALVIERADGSDSRLLAAGLFPEFDNSIWNVQWSISGRYVAWVSIDYSINAYNSSTIWLSDVNGEQIHKIVETAGSVHLSWSPTEDLLFVAYGDSSSNQSRLPSYTHAIISPIVGEPVTKIETNWIDEWGGTSHRYRSGFNKGWFDDGSAVYFLQRNHYGVMQTNGLIEQYTFPPHPTRFHGFHKGRMTYLIDYHVPQESRYRMVIHDLITDRQINLDDYMHHDNPKMLDYDVIWSPSGNKAIIRVFRCSEESEHIICPREAETHIKTSLLDWQTDEQLPTNEWLKIQQACLGCSRIHWSEDEEHIIFHLQYDGTYHFELQTQRLFRLPDEFDFSTWAWSSDGEGILFPVNMGHQHPDNGIRLYNLETQSIERLYPDYEVRFNFRLGLSPSGRYVNQYDGGRVLYDTHTGTLIEWQHNSEARGSAWFRLNWHHDEEWYFVESDSIQNMSLRAIMLRKLDGSEQREITACHNVDTCVGFVPLHVVPHLAN